MRRSPVRVAVHVFEAGLVHVLMGVLGPVLVGMRMLVCHMVVLMRGVRMRVRHIAMLVFVRVRRLVGVLAHGGRLLFKRVVSSGHSLGPPTAFSPLLPR